MINIYADESKGHEKSFMIYATIWGTPENCAEFEEELQQLIDNNRHVLGKDFKTFHANKLNTANWNTTGAVYRELILKLNEYEKDNKLKSLIYLESKEVHTKRVNFFKKAIDVALSNPEHGILKRYPELKTKDIPAIIHRFEHLYLYLIMKHKFEGEEFSYFPDSSGKILTYKGKKITDIEGKEVTFFQFLTKLANVVNVALEPRRNKQETKNLEQYLSVFEPLSDTDSFMIQVCDTLANFCYNSIRYSVGMTKPLYKEKADVFLSRFDKENLDKFQNCFSLKDGHAICIDTELAGSIE